jgi:DNA-binding NarL/FixJ family response regulator
MIRVAIFDRHPAVRIGLDTLLRAEPGVAPVGTAGEAADLVTLLYRTDPDVVVLDDVAVARRMRAEAPRARMLVYAAEVTPELVLAASVAGADAVVSKSAETRELTEAIRLVAAGERVLPAVGAREQARAAKRLDPRDRPIFAMRLAGTSPREIAAVVGVGVAALNARLQAIAAQLLPAPA